MLFFISVTQRPNGISVTGFKGHDGSDDIIISPRKINEFKKFVENHCVFTNEGSGLTADYYFSRFDEVLAKIQPEYVKQHGIFFTNDNLSKFALWYVKEYFSKDVHENYIVFDPAGGSGNLISSWRGKLKHKIISELQPDLYTQGTGVYKPTTNGSVHSGTAYSGTTLPTGSGVNTLTCGVSSNDRVANSNEQSSLSVTNTVNNTRINLYPNPNNGSMQVDYLIKDDAHMEMMDITGNIVGTYNLPANGTTIQLQNDNLQSGVYLYRIISNNTVIKQGKIVVMR